MKKILFSVLGVVALYTSCLSATITSANTGLWGDASTWVGGVLPTNSDSVVVATGHTVTLVGDRECQSLTINGTLLITTAADGSGAGTLFLNRVDNLFPPSGGNRYLVVNGTLTMNDVHANGSNESQVLLNGKIIFNNGSSFNLDGEATMHINGNGGSAAMSHTSGALFEIGTSTTFNIVSGKIYFYRPFSDGIAAISGTQNFFPTSGVGTNFVLFSGDPRGSGSTARLRVGADGSKPQFNRVKLVSSTIAQLDSVTVKEYVQIENGTLYADSLTTERLINDGTVYGKVNLHSTAAECLLGGIGTFHLNKIIVDNTGGTRIINDITLDSCTVRFVNGKISLGDKKLIFNTFAAFEDYDASKYISTDGTCYLQIPTSTTPRVVPVGYYTYEPVTISSSIPSSFSFRVSNMYGNLATYPMLAGHGFVDRIWFIENKLSNGATANISMRWSNALEYDNFHLYRPNARIFNTIGGVWTPTSAAGATDLGSGNWQHSTTNVSVFGAFSVLSTAVLPLNITRFGAKQTLSNTAHLTWAVSNDKHIEGFEIEKSTDAKNFETVAFVKAGNATEYNFEDTDFQEDAYYRLKQIDQNGDIFSTKIVFVKHQGTRLLVNAYPSVFSDKITVAMGTEPEKATPIQFFDLLGRLVLEQNTTNAVSEISTNDLGRGLYIIKIGEGKNATLLKVVKN